MAAAAATTASLLDDEPYTLDDHKGDTSNDAALARLLQDDEDKEPPPAAATVTKEEKKKRKPPPASSKKERKSKKKAKKVIKKASDEASSDSDEELGDDDFVPDDDEEEGEDLNETKGRDEGSEEDEEEGDDDDDDDDDDDEEFVIDKSKTDPDNAEEGEDEVMVTKKGKTKTTGLVITKQDKSQKEVVAEVLVEAPVLWAEFSKRYIAVDDMLKHYLTLVSKEEAKRYADDFERFSHDRKVYAKWALVAPNKSKQWKIDTTTYTHKQYEQALRTRKDLQGMTQGMEDMGIELLSIIRNKDSLYRSVYFDPLLDKQQTGGSTMDKKHAGLFSNKVDVLGNTKQLTNGIPHPPPPPAAAAAAPLAVLASPSPPVAAAATTSEVKRTGGGGDDKKYYQLSSNMFFLQPGLGFQLVQVDKLHLIKDHIDPKQWPLILEYSKFMQSTLAKLKSMTAAPTPAAAATAPPVATTAATNKRKEPAPVDTPPVVVVTAPTESKTEPQTKKAKPDTAAAAAPHSPARPLQPPPSAAAVAASPQQTSGRTQADIEERKRQAADRLKKATPPRSVTFNDVPEVKVIPPVTATAATPTIEAESKPMDTTSDGGSDSSSDLKVLKRQLLPPTATMEVGGKNVPLEPHCLPVEEQTRAAITWLNKAGADWHAGWGGVIPSEDVHDLKKTMELLVSCKNLRDGYDPKLDNKGQWDQQVQWESPGANNPQIHERLKFAAIMFSDAGARAYWKTFSKKLFDDGKRGSELLTEEVKEDIKQKRTELIEFWKVKIMSVSIPNISRAEKEALAARFITKHPIPISRVRATFDNLMKLYKAGYLSSYANLSKRLSEPNAEWIPVHWVYLPILVNESIRKQIVQLLELCGSANATDHLHPEQTLTKEAMRVRALHLEQQQ